MFLALFQLFATGIEKLRAKQDLIVVGLLLNADLLNP